MEQRGNWSSRRAFILAAIGSAIGLGNIWRFPFKCYESGGGAFLIAYLIAMLSAGIPLMVLELSFGHHFKLAAPLSFSKVKKKFEWIGWWAVIVGFMITTYYAVVMAWGLNYTVFSATQAWGKDTGDFFYNHFLNLTSGHFDFGGIQLPIIIALVVSWILIVGAIWKGAKTVSKVVYVTVFVPWLLLIAFVIRGVTLPGAMDGLKFYLTPHFEKLLDPSVWVAAYGQVFYSLSIGFGIMIAYASFLPKKSDIINSAMIIALCDGATAFIGGLAIFGALGYYANMTGQIVTEVLKGGPGLAFVTYPAIINMLPLAKVFGILFFLMLLTLAVDSAFSLVEAISSALRDKFGWSHKKANLITASVAFVIGILFTTGAGLYWLDVVDKWLEVFGLSMVVLVESIVLAWFFNIDELRQYANDYSEVKVGRWWNYILKFYVPIAVFALVLTDAIKLITKGYEGYPVKALLFGGWLVVIIVPILAIIISSMKRKGEVKEFKTYHPAEPFVSDIGYIRLYKYLKAVLYSGIVLILIIILSNFITSLEVIVTALIAIFIFLSLVGGAIYFAKISMKEGKRREKWAEEHLED